MPPHASLLSPAPELLAEFARPILEWDRLLALLAGYSASPLGRDWLLTLAPSSDVAWIEREHSLVAEMQLLLAEGGAQPSLGGLSDPTQLLAKSRLTGAALEPPEIRALLALAGAIDAWASTMRNPPDRFRSGGLPRLLALTEPVLDAALGPLVESIEVKLLPDGSLADTASAELGRIRRDIDRQQRSIEDALRSALRRLSEGGSTQDDLITIRGDRFVIPVKAEAKRRVSGVVHGASSSGQTVYLEPLETIELNNDLVRLFEEELGEIHRIFLAITAQLAAQAHLLVPGAAILATVETLVIRARFAAQYDCVRPRFVVGPKAELRLVAARHPLLEHRLREQAKNRTAHAETAESRYIPSAHDAQGSRSAKNGSTLDHLDAERSRKSAATAESRYIPSAHDAQRSRSAKNGSTLDHPDAERSRESAAGGHFVAGDPSFVTSQEGSAFSPQSDQTSAGVDGAPGLAPTADDANTPAKPEPPSPKMALREGTGPKIVPLSLALEPDKKQLIISGPNTGGKTVGLKTTGLLCLMAQAGIPVPAFEATLPILSAVLADIGDFGAHHQPEPLERACRTGDAGAHR